MRLMLSKIKADVDTTMELLLFNIIWRRKDRLLLFSSYAQRKETYFTIHVCIFLPEYTWKNIFILKSTQSLLFLY